MATPKFLDYLTGDQTVFPTQTAGADVPMRMLAALAAIASGSNPDGTTSPSGEGSGGIVAANILNGFQTFSVSTGATILLTVPAGRTWQGVCYVSVACAENAADTAQAGATAIFATGGVGVIPAVGPFLEVDAFAGANVVAGLTGTQAANNGSLPVTVVAPAGNAVTITVQAVCAGDISRVRASAFGLLL